MKAFLLVSHGSRSKKLHREIKALVSTLKARSRIPIAEYAFLDVSSPDIPSGIETCILQGAREVLVLLNFLNSGKHVDQDIPAIIKKAQEAHPGIKFSLSKPVGQHPGISDLFLKMVKEAS